MTEVGAENKIEGAYFSKEKRANREEERNQRKFERFEKSFLKIKDLIAEIGFGRYQIEVTEDEKIGLDQVDVQDENLSKAIRALKLGIDKVRIFSDRGHIRIIAGSDKFGEKSDLVITEDNKLMTGVPFDGWKHKWVATDVGGSEASKTWKNAEALQVVVDTIMALLAVYDQQKAAGKLKEKNNS